MDHFAYRSRSLYCENIPVAQLAERYGTPLYIYSKATLVHHLRQIQEAFKEVEPLICYSVKTNGNVAL
ncbi:MAG: diaminopimelate decarboxylase, partial [Actinomycetes bacterium]